MKLDVLLEKIDAGYRATWAGAFQESAEGPTRDEALDRLRRKVQDRLHEGGAEVVELDIGPFSHPSMGLVGTWGPNDPFIQEYLKEVEAYRSQYDEEPSPG